MDSRSSLLAKGKKDDCVVHLKGLVLFGEAGGEMPWHLQDREDFSSIHEWLQKTIQPALGVKNGLNFVLGHSEGHSVFYRARPIQRRESSPIVP